MICQSPCRKPGGQKITARRFIAGFAPPGIKSPVRDERTSASIRARTLLINPELRSGCGKLEPSLDRQRGGKATPGKFCTRWWQARRARSDAPYRCGFATGRFDFMTHCGVRGNLYKGFGCPKLGVSSACSASLGLSAPKRHSAQPVRKPAPPIGNRQSAIGNVLALFFLLVAWPALAQVPHLAYVYPAGGKAGSTFQITVGGQALLTASNAFITGPGVHATVLDHNRPMNQKDFNDLRDTLKALQDKFQASRKGVATGTNVWTAADAMEREQIRAKILKNPPNRTASPAMIDTVVVKVVIDAAAAPGEQEIRLATPNALSNPLRFCVGTLPEISRPAAKPANPDLDKYLERIGGAPALTGTPKHEARVELPVTINGQIMPGGVDRYQFYARQGQHLIIAVNARSLIPYLADAVPGWFEATLTLLDGKGAEVASAERYRFRPDPVLHFEVPRDGMYTVVLHDSIFRGREDFVYRLTLGELPFVTGIFPLGGPAGEKTGVTLTGWNLAETNLTLDNTAASPGVIALPGNYFNAPPFAVDDLPECLASDANATVATAQAVTLPVIINGRIRQPGRQNVYQFAGHAGETIVAEVYARRLDSPLDSFLRLTDAAGKQLAFNDDFEDKGSGLNTHHADSYLTNTLPADGTYFIHVTDTQGGGGPDYAYRLRISEPRPDFALRLVPSSLSLRAGMSLPVTVFALRRDGFTNAITLELKDAPKGFSLSGARIGDNQDKAQFTLKAPAQATEAPVAITVAGSAKIGGQRVEHVAAPSDDLMQAFIYRHLVPSRELAVMVSGPERPFLRDAFKILSATPVKLAPGGTALVRVSAPPGNNFTNRWELALENPPDGITLTSVASTAAGLELKFSCDADKVKSGAAGNLICDVLARNQNPLNATNAARKLANQQRRPAVATLPAVPFTVMVE